MGGYVAAARDCKGTVNSGGEHGTFCVIGRPAWAVVACLAGMSP